MPEYNGQADKLGLVETLECEAAEPMPKSHPLMTLRGAAAEDDVDIIGGFVSFAKCVCHCLLLRPNCEVEGHVHLHAGDAQHSQLACYVVADTLRTAELCM